MTKYCAECGETQSRENFHNSKGRPDGKQPYCNACMAPRDPDATPPITVTNASQREPYRPAADRSFYRNEGNKHIKSRGTLT